MDSVLQSFRAEQDQAKPVDQEKLAVPSKFLKIFNMYKE